MLYAELPWDKYQVLSLIYVNDLQYASNLLDPIMFADDTNLFYTEENIKTLLDIVNIEL